MQKIIVSVLYSLVILIPLTFSPFSLELFEFPKFLLLLSGTLIITLTWGMHIYQTKEKPSISLLSPISYAMLAVLATQALATIFSIHPYTSFWGYYSRFHQGLLTTVCYTIIYFAAVYWLDTKSTQKLIKISVRTAIVVSLIAILEHYDVSLTCALMTFFTHLKNATEPFIWSTSCWGIATNPLGRSFATLGQPNWLAAYLIPNIFLLLYLTRTKKSKSYSLYSIFSFSVLLIALLFTRSRSGFLAFGLSFITYFFLLARQHSFIKIKKLLLLSSSIYLLVSLLLGTPFTPSLSSLLSPSISTTVPTTSGTVLETGGTESGDIRKIVWTGAVRLVLQHPILGTGPETFAYTYYATRPLAHNMTSEWDFLYNKAHNEYLNIAAGAGLIGLAAYLYFHYAVFATSFTKIAKSKKIDQDKDSSLRELYPVLGASIVAFAVTNFFGFSVVPVYFMMILIAALPTTITKNTPPSPPISYLLSPIFLIILLYPLNLYLADQNYARGKANLDAGKINVAIPLLQKAVSKRSGLDLYHATLGEAYAQNGQAEEALKELKLNQTENPVHLNFFKSRAKIYLTLASADPTYNLLAKDELLTARELAPTDPKLAYNLGLLFTRLNDAKSSEMQLKEAIALKPNYAEPYYALTLLYEQTKQADKIPDLLNDAKSHLATYSAQLREKMEKYTSK